MKGGADLEFEGIYKEYFKEVYLYVRSLSADEVVAEEITQDVFFKAFKNINRFDYSKDIRAWLFTIAKNTYFTYLKKHKKDVSDDECLSFVPDNSLNFEQHLCDEESAFKIHQFIHSMKEPYKEVFSLRVFGELPFEKIGILFGKTSGWARVTYYRAKTMILDYMEGENE